MNGPPPAPVSPKRGADATIAVCHDHPAVAGAAREQTGIRNVAYADRLASMIPRATPTDPKTIKPAPTNSSLAKSVGTRPAAGSEPPPLLAALPGPGVTEPGSGVAVRVGVERSGQAPGPSVKTNRGAAVATGPGVGEESGLAATLAVGEKLIRKTWVGTAVGKASGPGGSGAGVSVSAGCGGISSIVGVGVEIDSVVGVVTAATVDSMVGVTSAATVAIAVVVRDSAAVGVAVGVLVRIGPFVPVGVGVAVVLLPTRLTAGAAT